MELAFGAALRNKFNNQRSLNVSNNIEGNQVGVRFMYYRSVDWLRFYNDATT